MMRMLNFGAAVGVLALAACSNVEDAPAGTDEADRSDEIAMATMADATGQTVGEVRLVEAGSGLVVRVSLSGVGGGEHGFHLHTTGRCDGPDFASAGGHLNPTGNTHGSLSERGKHLGDLPNLTIPESQSLTTEIVIEGETDEILASLFDEDGTAVMLHAGPDDYISDPAGDAGPRIACGVLGRTS